MRNSVGVLGQFFSLLHRNIDLYINDKRKVIMTMALPVLIGVLILAVTDTDMVGKYYESTKNILFTIVSAAIYVGIFNSLNTICKERNIIKREYMTGMKLSSYILAQVVFQAMLCLVQAELFMILFWGEDKVGFAIESTIKGTPFILDSAYLQYLVSLFLIMLAADIMGLFISSLVPNGEMANLLAPIIIIIQLVLAGVLFQLEGMMDKMASLTVSKWGIEALGTVTNLTTMDKLIKNNEAWESIKDVAEEMAEFSSAEKSAYEYTFDNLAYHWQVLAGFVCVLTVLCIVTLRRVEKDKR